MPTQAVIVWDLETVPDLGSVGRLLGLVDKNSEETFGLSRRDQRTDTRGGMERQFREGVAQRFSDSPGAHSP
jgi:hypothetical protein